MIKLIAQIMTTCVIWYVTKSFNLNLGFSVAAIFCGIFVVHFIWQKFFFNPYVYLGVMSVDHDDPLMKEAERKSAETFEYFIEKLFPQHKQDSTVKFIYTCPSGDKEKIWGDLISIDSNKLEVFVRTIPTQVNDDFKREMIVAELATVFNPRMGSAHQNT